MDIFHNKTEKLTAVRAEAKLTTSFRSFRFIKLFLTGLSRSRVVDKCRKSLKNIIEGSIYITGIFDFAKT